MEDDNTAGEERFVTIFEAYGIIEAEIVRSKLECAGIPVMIAKVETVYPANVDGFAKIPLVIPQKYQAEAEMLLQTDDPEK